MSAPKRSNDCREIQCSILKTDKVVPVTWQAHRQTHVEKDLTLLKITAQV